MTTPQRFTIEVSEAELDVVRLALGREVTPKPVRSKRAPVETFSPQTGDPRLDEWMRRNRARVGPPKALPKIPTASTTFPHGNRKMTARERDMLVRWDDAARLAARS